MPPKMLAGFYVALDNFGVPQGIDPDAILRNHKAKKVSHLNEKNTFVWIEPYFIMNTS